MGGRVGGGQLASLQGALDVIRKIQVEGIPEAKVVTEIQARILALDRPQSVPCQISREEPKNTGGKPDQRVPAAFRRLCFFPAPQFTKSGKERKELLPSCVSSKAWRAYHSDKEAAGKSKRTPKRPGQKDCPPTKPKKSRPTSRARNIPPSGAPSTSVASGDWLCGKCGGSWAYEATNDLDLGGWVNAIAVGAPLT